ncbi:hypothetical protein J2S37_001151 [Corynebacterium felinum]|uniref:Uncharacterized protein n=1 Tax=Corynebacterium felinum TaxID=131318 RepID=A0ABU2BA44_9CORY|nr:hypothetical protein [Corynebacterium felinum]
MWVDLVEDCCVEPLRGFHAVGLCHVLGVLWGC